MSEIKDFIKFIIFNKYFIKFISIFIWSKKIRHFLKDRVLTVSGIKLNAKLKNDYKNYRIFLVQGGLGELIETLILMKSFKQKYEEKVLFVTESKLYKDVIEIFDSVDESLLVTKSEYLGLKGLLPKADDAPLPPELDNINSLITAFDWKTLYLKDHNVPFNTILDGVKNLIGLDPAAEIEKPAISVEYINNAKNIFNDMGLKEGKTIFIAPFANSYNSGLITNSMWGRIADEFISKGFDVVFNAKQDDFKGYNTVLFSMKETVAFADLCSYIISFRSGFAEVMAVLSSTDMTVIYPAENIQEYKGIRNEEIRSEMIPILKEHYSYNDELSFVQNEMRIYSLKTMFERNNIEEITFDGDEKKLTDTLLSQVSVEAISFH